MNISLIPAVAAATLFFAVCGPAAAQAISARQLAVQNACLGCHAISSRIVGPAYTEIAARYKGQDAAKLASSIRTGSKGQWGSMEMPAQAALSEADALRLAQWILAGSPEQ